MEVPNRVPWINIAIGILTIVSTYALGVMSGAVMTSNWIAGAVIVIVAFIELASYARGKSMHYWPVVNVLAGIWLLISTSLAGPSQAMVWSDVVLGIAAIVTSAVALSYESVHSRVPITHS